MSLLLKIGGENYFIDFNNIEKVLSKGISFKGGMVTNTTTEKMLDANGELVSTKVTTEEYHKSREVDGFRFQTIGDMIDILFQNNEEEDLLTHASLNKKPLSFKLAFNTLLEYGILNIIIDEEEK